MINPFKICACCGTKTYNHRKRVCDKCGVPAIWNIPTTEQIKADVAERDRLESLMRDLLKEMSS